jgi:hypothetical protein
LLAGMHTHQIEDRNRQLVAHGIWMSKRGEGMRIVGLASGGSLDFCSNSDGEMRIRTD